MCFVFVFVALLEYAAVNYFFWGARAKKKKKKQRPLSNSLPGPGVNYQATYNSSNGRAHNSHDDRKVGLCISIYIYQSMVSKVCQ